jgi:uncharacterized protein
MTEIQHLVLKDTVVYTGRELRSGWILDTCGLAGDAAVGFVGPCGVETEDLVDLDDARAGAVIVAAEMAHVIVEHVNCPITTAVLRQRLLVCILCEILTAGGTDVLRDGDDVYIGDRKLTVSIAAPSRSGGALIHLGINVDPEGAPVPAVGLVERGISPVDLLEELLERYGRELHTAGHAETKVRTVG